MEGKGTGPLAKGGTNSHEVRHVDFLRYNKLVWEERLFFAHSGLDRFVGIAGQMLKKRIGAVETHKLDHPYFSDSDLTSLNSLVEQLLELIGRHSNSRFGLQAERQDRFFHRPSEMETFPTHLFISRWQDGKSTLEENPKYKETIKKNASLPGSAFSSTLFTGIPAAAKLTYCPKKLTKTETRAVGVLYMVGLIWDLLRESQKKKSKKAQHFDTKATLRLGFTLYSLLDESDILVSRSVGGQSGSKKKEYPEATSILVSLFNGAPQKNTKILAKNALARISEECVESESPAERWVLDKIRELKRNLRRK